jgi:hypothetical protein
MRSSNPRDDHDRIAAEWIASLGTRARGRGTWRRVEGADRFHDPAGHACRTALPLFAAAILDGDAGPEVGQAVEDLARFWALDPNGPEDAAAAIEAVRPILAARSGAGNQGHGDAGKGTDPSRREDACAGPDAGVARDPVIDARIAALAARVAAAVADCREQIRALPSREAARVHHMEERTRCRSGRPLAR